MGSTQSLDMDHVVHKIWHWVISKNNWLSAIHIAGVLNEEADEESRQQELRTEWVLNRQDFKFVVEKLGFIITVNLFVSYINTLQFQLKAPLLNNFWIFCRSPLSYLDPPPPNPYFINFPDFVLQILQRLSKPIVLFAKLQAA